MPMSTKSAKSDSRRLSLGTHHSQGGSRKGSRDKKEQTFNKESQHDVAKQLQ